MVKGFNVKVLVAAVAASLLLALGNNLFNREHRVAWIGSPEILPKPEGWPTLNAGQGMAAGVKSAWKGFRKQQGAILGTLAALGIFLWQMRRYGNVPLRPVLMSILRIGLGLMFITAAWGKFLEPDGFALLVAQYQFLPAPLVNFFALWLAAFELVVGFGIILLPWEKEYSLLLGVLMAMFIIALGQALARGLGIACGCFDIEGAADAGETWFALIRDVVLLGPIAWMAIRGSRRFLWQTR